MPQHGQDDPSDSLKLRFFIRSVDFDRFVEILIGAYQPDGSLVRLEPALFSREEETQTGAREPWLQLDQDTAPEFLQSMMDALWEHGVRPKDVGTAGHLAATKEHLADMRTMATKLLDRVLKEAHPTVSAIFDGKEQKAQVVCTGAETPVTIHTA